MKSYIDVIEKMQKKGGSFESHLATTFLWADQKNKGILLKGFPSIWKKWKLKYSSANYKI